jgi:hypothetical protein
MNKDSINAINKVPLIPSISSLHQEKFVKETNKIDIYNIVLNKIIEKILYTNRHTDKTYVIFEVPKILIGYPQYDMKSCILFIINKLSLNDYFVEFMDPFYIYIDWGSKESIYKRRIKNEIPKPLYIPKFAVKNADNLKAQTKALLSQFPDTSKIEFVYEDKYKESNKQNNKNKKKTKIKGKNKKNK